MKKTLFLLLLMIANYAFAKDYNGSQTIGDIADQASSYVPDMSDVMSAICYVCGIGFGFMSAIKLKENAETNGKSGMVKPIIYFVCCALCLMLPTYITTGTNSVGLENSRSATQY